MINEEATRFLYQRNIFHALVRDNSAISRFDQVIYPSYVYLFQNVVIEHKKEMWSSVWIHNTAASIQTLIESDVSLSSLTLVFAPKAPTADMAAGKPTDMTKLASFFAEGSLAMKLLTKIRCRVLNLVIKLGKVKVVASLDVRHLKCDYTTSPFVDDEATKEGRTIRTEKAKDDLGGLKMAVNRIASNWEEAVQLGVCRVMEEGEDISDGAALKRA